MVYSDFNFLTSTPFTLSIEVLLTSQKREISCICVRFLFGVGSGVGGVILSVLPLHFLHFFIKFLHSYNALHQRY